MRLTAHAFRIFVSNLDRARHFYQKKLGLYLEHDGAPDGYLVFASRHFRLIVELADLQDKEARQLVGRFLGFSFRVDDVQEAYDTLSARGVEFDAAPEPQAWGGGLAHFFDPDRNVITLVAYDAE